MHLYAYATATGLCRYMYELQSIFVRNREGKYVVDASLLPVIYI